MGSPVTRRCEPPTGPGAAYVARDRVTAADGDGGEQWEATQTITPVPGKPGRIRYARRLPDGRERLRDPETGRALRMDGDCAAFKGPDPLTPVFGSGGAARGSTFRPLPNLWRGRSMASAKRRMDHA
jgi:hypothetical protein